MEERDRDTIMIEYDDMPHHIIENVNRVLSPHGLRFVDDGKEHSGYCLYQLVKREAE